MYERNLTDVNAVSQNQVCPRVKCFCEQSIIASHTTNNTCPTVYSVFAAVTVDFTRYVAGAPEGCVYCAQGCGDVLKKKLT